MFDGRRLNHQLPKSIVSPSRWSTVPPRLAYAAPMRSITAAGLATFVLISPEPT